MITLALETSTPRGSAAVVRNDEILAEETFERSKPQEHLFGAIQEALNKADVKVSDLDLIAVGLGPGSYTGIRCGIAGAKGLALPLTLPIKGVHSYDAIAREAIKQTSLDCLQVCVLGDARRGEIYYTVYERNGRKVSDCKLATIESLADEVHDPICFVSSEIEKFQESIREILGGFATVCEQSHFPSASWIGKLGISQYQRDDEFGDEKIEPIYLRPMQYTTT